MEENCFKYRKVLKRYNPQMLLAAEKTFSASTVSNVTLKHIVCHAVSPVLFDYVYWMLCEARNKKIERLYFFARDGFILYKIALLIVKKLKLNVDCRYLYISRFASRIPLYHFSLETAFDFICEKKIFNSLRTVIQNITLDKNEFEYIRKLLNIEENRLDRELSLRELEELKNSFLENEALKSYVYSLSEKAYESAVKYFAQEGLYENVSFAFADVGWRGTLQVSLNRLLSKRIPAFYFGLYTDEFLKKSCNDLWTSYYFSSSKNFLRKLHFNNSLFECFCTAPDGMTSGYEFKNGKWIALFASEGNVNCKKWFLQEQLNLIEAWTENYLSLGIPDSPSVKMDEKLLCALMFRPAKNEAELYGSYLFSDETNEENLIQLAPEYTEKDFKAVLLRLLHKSLKRKCVKSFWRYGSIARSKLDFLSKFVFRSYCYAVSVWTYIKQK
ncbi:MAG: hypothetical protein J6O39_01770 [Treponema sp.]|nr:hypothetical protein [Treponema sp.]